MKGCCLVVLMVVFAAGCAADGNKGSWDEALKDLRGDNMRMRSSFSKMAADDSEYSKPKLRD